MNTRDVLAGAGIGAALTFMLDPSAGGRRRALVRDKAVKATRLTRDGLDATARDITNRTRGIVAATRGRFSSESVDDARVLDRVRAQLGRVCSHPRAIDVEVANCEVTLRGDILASEVDDVIASAAAVRGVRNVISELDAHENAAGVPALQGEGRIAGPRLDILQSNWAPATKALVGVAAVATGLCLVGYARRNNGEITPGFA
jgi:hypothetical protein